MHNEDASAGDDRVGRLRSLREGVGRRLRAVRTALGETQAMFGLRMGVTKLSISNYESGKTSPTVDLLADLERSGIDVDFVAFGRPSLATKDSRNRFAQVHTWVQRECRLRTIDISDADLMDLAWLVFSKLDSMCAEVATSVVDLSRLVDQALEVSE